MTTVPTKLHQFLVISFNRVFVQKHKHTDTHRTLLLRTIPHFASIAGKSSKNNGLAYERRPGDIGEDRLRSVLYSVPLQFLRVVYCRHPTFAINSRLHHNRSGRNGLFAVRYTA